MNSKLRALICGAAAVSLVGCATHPSNVTSTYTSSNKYDAYDCAKLEREAEEVSAKVASVTGALQTKFTTDAVLVGVGLIVFWPALLALPATGGKAEEQELARVKGESEALVRAMKEKNCPAIKAAAPAPVKEAVQETAPPTEAPAKQG